MQKKTAKLPARTAKKKKPPVKKQDQKFSLKRLIMGEEKPDLTELEAGSTTVLDILSPTTIDTKSRDYIVVDGIFHACLYVAGYGYSTTVGSCWLAPLVEAGEGVNLSFNRARFYLQAPVQRKDLVQDRPDHHGQPLPDAGRGRHPPGLRGAGQRD